MPESIGSERVHIALISWLNDLANAFDAADRGCHDQAGQLQAAAFAGIRDLLDNHPILDRELPELRNRLDEANPFFDTAPFIEAAQARVLAIRAGADSG